MAVPLRWCPPWRLAVAGLAALLALTVGRLDAEDDVAPPTTPSRPGAVGSTATVRLEILGKGLIPTARVIISDPGPDRMRFGRRWTYEVVPQTAILDRSQMGRWPDIHDDRTFALADLQCAPEARVFLTLAEDDVFRSGGDHRPILVEPGKGWGHDHALDLRPAGFRNQVVFVRLTVSQVAAPLDSERDGPRNRDGAPLTTTSDWIRYLLPDVPDVPLVRFGSDARKLGDPQFARIAKDATVFTATATSGDFPWTRVLAVAKDDPLYAFFPRLLLDGKSTHVVGDGEPYRFAVTGIDGSRIEADATVVSVQPLR